MKNTIINNKDGSHNIKISFDITEHGHSFGLPRNYNLSKIMKLVRSKTVQDSIKNGYAICFYGHGARAKEQGYLANEKNHATGEVQEPIGKVTSLSMKDKIVTYTAKLVETSGNKTKSVIKLIEHNIGGFSFVFDVPNGVFYGSDFVLSPNFNGNRVVMDSICGEGGCKLDTAIRDTVLDAIGENEDLYETAKDLLEHQDSVTEALEFKGKVMAMQDNITALQDEVLEKDIIIDNHNITIDGQNESIEKLNSANQKAQLDAIEAKVTPLQEEIVELKEQSEKLQVLQDSIEESGLEVVDGLVVLDSTAFGSLFSTPSKDKNSFNEVQLDGLRKPSKQNANELETIELKY